MTVTSSDAETDRHSPTKGSAANGHVEEAPLTTPERKLWYVEKLFVYTNQLIDRTQARCNYLIFANSVAAVAFFTAMNALIANRGVTDRFLSKNTVVLLLLLPTSIFLCSLVAAVMAFLPKIYRYEIELNQSFIARMSASEYRVFVDAKPDANKLDDFIDEIHVLSMILNDKNTLVNASARIFLIAICTIPIVTIMILL